MKVFMITWGGLCFLVIVGLIIVYATDQLPGVPVPQSRSESPDKSGQVGLKTEAECSPCEENLKQLKEAQQRGERERNVQAVAVSDTDDSP